MYPLAQTKSQGHPWLFLSPYSSSKFTNEPCQVFLFQDVSWILDSAALPKTLIFLAYTFAKFSNGSSCFYSSIASPPTSTQYPPHGSQRYLLERKVRKCYFLCLQTLWYPRAFRMKSNDLTVTPRSSKIEALFVSSPISLLFFFVCLFALVWLYLLLLNMSILFMPWGLCTSYSFWNTLLP